MTQDMKQTREVIKSDQLNLWRLKSALRLLFFDGAHCRRLPDRTKPGTGSLS